jgi:hypothetical protein
LDSYFLGGQEGYLYQESHPRQNEMAQDQVLTWGYMRDSTVYANIFANKNCREIRELGIVTAN